MIRIGTHTETSGRIPKRNPRFLKDIKKRHQMNLQWQIDRLKVLTYTSGASEQSVHRRFFQRLFFASHEKILTPRVLARVLLSLIVKSPESHSVLASGGLFSCPDFVFEFLWIYRFSGVFRTQHTGITQ